MKRPARKIAKAAVCLFALSVSACSAAVDCSDLDEVSSGETLLCQTEGYFARDYLLHVPDGYDGEQPLPLVLSLHGSGFTKETHDQLTCRDGDVESASCLYALTRERGYVLATLDGPPASAVGPVRSSALDKL